LRLSLEVSERSVSQYLVRGSRNGDAHKFSLVFLRRHREALAATDFFTVPRATFRLLYYFFVTSHSRRKVFHFNTTEHPTSPWVVQQLCEAFPEDTACRYLILNRDPKYEGETTELLQAVT
jgi:putative transposase